MLARRLFRVLALASLGCLAGPPDNCYSSRWPEDGRSAEVCGSVWQARYAALHANAVRMSNQMAPRYPGRPTEKPRIIVFDTLGNGGYADRLTGLMTVLLLGILTDRAIAVDWEGIEMALGSPRLDLTALLKSARDANVENDVHRLSWVNKNRLELQELTTGGTPLNELWPERVLVVKSNRGFTQALLRSPAHAHALYERGLNFTNAQFGCLFNYLFRPTIGALAPASRMHGELAQARRDGVPVVGIHVRTGDNAFHENVADMPDYQKELRGERLYVTHRFIVDYALSLAASLEQAWTVEGGEAPRAKFLLLGDSVPLRQHVAGLLGDRLITMSNNTVGHVAKGSVRSQREALQNAVAEHWLYAAAGAFVYSSHSGFPRTAAARAMRDDAIHTCFHYQGVTFAEQQHGKPKPKRECTGPHSVRALGERHAAGL